MLVNYRQIIESDIPWVVEISDLQFGKNYLDEERLLNLMADENTRIPVSASGRLVIGFSIIHFVKKKDLFNYLDPKFSAHFESIHPGMALQVRKTTAIHPEFTGKGFGLKFIQFTMARTERRFDAILSINWIRNGVTSMDGILKKVGMTPLAELEEYWYDDSIKYNFNCPECGNPPCKCRAIAYSNI